MVCLEGDDVRAGGRPAREFRREENWALVEGLCGEQDPPLEMLLQEEAARKRRERFGGPGAEKRWHGVSAVAAYSAKGASPHDFFA